MSADDARVLQLLKEALDSDRTPEEVCADTPELLQAVRARWEHCRRLENRLNDLFPSARSSSAADDDGPADARGAERFASRGAELPSIPGYVVEAVLGHGGVGVVYRARHLGLRRTVALKMLLSGAYAGRVERARFLREAQAVAALRHAHVVQVHDVGEHDGRPYFTMELMDGGSLAEQLGGVPQPPDEAAAMIETLAGAVEAAHRAGIVHRDLKPANVLLSSDGTAKVSDFGLAHQIIDEGDLALTISGARLGTPSYMAPEQAAGRHGAVGPAADVYALGAVLYEMLTGRPPFRGDSAAETERQVIAEDPAPPSRLNARVPRDLETICLRCLSKDPARRYASAAALADDVRRFQRSEPIAARRAGRIERVAKWVRRRPAAATAFVGALLITGMLGGAVLWVLADRAATARAVEEDLRVVVELQQASKWPEANAVLDRATWRLGGHGPAQLRARLASVRADSDLALRLEDIRMSKSNSTNGVVRMLGQSSKDYAAAFRAAGLGAVLDNPDVVAGRIRASHVRTAIVAGLDDWFRLFPPKPESDWLTSVASIADDDPTGWRARARDPNTFADPKARAALIADPSAPAQPVSLVLRVAEYLDTYGDDAMGFLIKAQRLHPDDFWLNYHIGRWLRQRGKAAESLRYFQAAIALRPNISAVHVTFANAINDAGRPEEAIVEYREGVRLDPHLGTAWRNMGPAFEKLGRTAEWEQVLRDGIRAYPQDANLHAILGDLLHDAERDDDALAEYRRAVALDPTVPQAQRNLRAILLKQGKYEEMRAAWREMIAAQPPNPFAWEGHAEYCLFVGDTDGYREVTRQLLERFANCADSRLCERMGRACLLLPSSDENIKRATSLIDRAVGSAKRDGDPVLPYFLVAKGLAEYRAGHFEETIELMKGPAGKVLEPIPHLILAMAQARAGHDVEARVTLANGIAVHDWSPADVRTSDECMIHVLRREAEAIILPKLPDFLAGRYQPESNAERVAMSGALQFLELNAKRATLWSEAIAADPRLASRGRYPAVSAAAQAGCGVGKDCGALSDVERTEWRRRAREWFCDELTDASKEVTSDADRGDHSFALQVLDTWSASSSMACVRDPQSLALLPAAEQQEWADLWQRAAAIRKKNAPQQK